ncbi:MAG: ribosome maturation factor RimP [Methylococcales bacterium]|nr:ribosome maturation factor RimP [Methylococcales bacterium]
MKQAPEAILTLLEPVVKGLGYECVGIEFNPHPKHGLLRIFIDKPDGVLLEDCSLVSHHVSGVLDVEDPIPGEYRLEVSSPGDDRPLFKLEQFAQFIGRDVNVTLFAPIAGRRRWQGVIDAVVEDAVVLRTDAGAQHIPFRSMSKARLVPEYS